MLRAIIDLQKEYPLTLHTINEARNQWSLYFGDYELPLTAFPADCDFFACLSIVGVKNGDSVNAWKNVLTYVKTRARHDIGRCIALFTLTVHLCETSGPYVLPNRYSEVVVSGVDLQVVRSFANVFASQRRRIAHRS